MPEAMLSYFNRIRVCPYPNVAGAGGPGGLVPGRRWGDLPTAPAYVASPGFTAPTDLGGRLVDGWLELVGIKSISVGGMDANMQKLGHQQSPGNVEQMAPGRMGPMTIQLVFNYSAYNAADLWALLPGLTTAPAYPALDAATPEAKAYVSRAKGRLVWEVQAADGLRLRTLGALSLPAPWEAPDDSAPMTTTATVNGSGRPLLVTPYGFDSVLSGTGGGEWVLQGTGGFDTVLTGAGGGGGQDSVLVGGPGGGIDSTLDSGGPPWTPTFPGP